MGIERLRAAARRVPRSELATFRQDIYRELAEGRISEDEAAELETAMHRAPGASAPRAPGHAPAAAVEPRAPRLPFPRRPIAREELERRRRWAASGWLPPQLAARFTSGELAALSVVASYSFTHGAFAWSHDRLARAAGVSVSTARNALREARRLGLVSAEERRSSPYRHRPNVVRILSREWAAWLANRRKRQGVRISPADNTVQEKQGFSGGGVAASRAPGLDSQALRKPGPCRNRKSP